MTILCGHGRRAFVRWHVSPWGKRYEVLDCPDCGSRFYFECVAAGVGGTP